MMETLLTPLINLGGMGMLAAVLFVLNREAIKTFREELAAERANYQLQAQKDRDAHAKQIADSIADTARKHEQIMASLATQSTETAAAFGRLFGLMEARKQ